MYVIPIRDLEKDPYSPDEERVAKYLVDLTGLGAGNDPIGFLMLSHFEFVRERQTRAGRKVPAVSMPDRI